MKNYLFFKYTNFFLKEYIFIFLLSLLLLFIPIKKSFAEKSVFVINNVEVVDQIDLHFSREKNFNKAFVSSFKILMSKILLSEDLYKIKSVKVKEIKKLIKNFQVIEESYRKNEYRANIKIFYNDIKVKKFLSKKNISFTQPQNISAVFFPIFFINNEMQNINKNFFYNQWKNIEIKNQLINFVLPIEDLDDISKITKMKNKIEELNVDDLVNKYNIQDYVFALLDYKEDLLNVHLKTNFNENKTNKNISYKLKKIEDTEQLNFIVKDLKIKINDIWKKESLVNLLMPLSIKVKFKHNNINDLDNFRKDIYKVSIIEDYILEQFDINNSYFQIYYYGNPKKLRNEFIKYGYQLKNDQGIWQIYLNE